MQNNAEPWPCTGRGVPFPVKSWNRFVSVSGVLLWDIWGWLRRFAAERRRVREPERSREAAQRRLRLQAGF